MTLPSSASFGGEQPTDEEIRGAAIVANVERIVRLITNCAQHMVGKLNGTVYLVGSTLHNPAPRDCDVRIIVADHEFGARYGLQMQPTTKKGLTHCIAWDEDGPTQRWIDDCAKTGAEWSVRLGLNVDYKVWPLSYWRKPYPTPLVLAAPTPRWFIYNKYNPDPSLPEKAAVEPPDGAR